MDRTANGRHPRTSQNSVLCPTSFSVIGCSRRVPMLSLHYRESVTLSHGTECRFERNRRYHRDWTLDHQLALFQLDLGPPKLRPSCNSTIADETPTEGVAQVPLRLVLLSTYDGFGNRRFDTPPSDNRSWRSISSAKQTMSLVLVLRDLSCTCTQFRATIALILSPIT